MSKADSNLTAAAGGTGRGADRREAILDAALDVFMRYGFSRVTMDDIARAAGISRPALYQDFRNKADIYQALAAVVLNAAAEAAETALAAQAPLQARIEGAIRAGYIAMTEEISASPHGAEILDMRNDISGEVIDAWHGRIAAAFAAAIAAEADARGVDLAARGFTADGLAQSLLDGLDGIKHRVGDPAQWEDAARPLVRLVTLALA